MKMTRAEFKNRWKIAMNGVGNDFVNELVRTAPVDTGFLRNSVRYEVIGSKINIHMPEYAFYIEFGTAPHEIRAVNAKALHWKSGGQDVFAQVVHHPGTEPNPFIRTAINTKLRDIIYSNLQRQLA
jgi:hypothetical protein